LFKHVGLDLPKMRDLGNYDRHEDFQEVVRRKLDELSIRANSASIAMTRRFSDWWEQRKHKFRYDFQGEYFRIWASDDLDPSEIELDQRSYGMQYFFSFYLVFLVESEGAHENAVLLLDDPGLHLHGTAQAKVVEFLRKLSASNQVLYTTHSPFMIDVDHLECARAVYEDEDGTTKVSEDVWPRDKDTLFPLQAALGYNVAQGLFVSKRQLIVEGITDLWILKALGVILEHKGLPGLRSDVVIVPAAGVTKLLPLASMLLGHGVEVAVLLDGDEPGRRYGEKLTARLLKGQERRCLFVGDFCDGPGEELEDLFPEEYYLSAVRQAYPDVRLSFTKEEKEMASVTKRVGALFERRGVRFEKWRPAQIIRDQILKSMEDVPEAALQGMQKISAAVNELFEGPVSSGKD